MKIEEKKSGETAREYAYHTIRDNIISLELEPGAPFNDIEVSQQIGISRTPVREAVIQLSEESRIIQIFPQRGMRIALIDVELVVCGMACEDDLNWLDENIRLQEFYLEGGSPEKLLELDNEMHKKLFSICRKELTYNMCQRLAIHYDRIRSLSVTTVKDYKIIGEHRELLDAIRSKDTKRAVETMDRHLNNWMLNEKLFREQYPQYFK